MTGQTDVSESAGARAVFEVVFQQLQDRPEQNANDDLRTKSYCVTSTPGVEGAQKVISARTTEGAHRVDVTVQALPQDGSVTRKVLVELRLLGSRSFLSVEYGIQPNDDGEGFIHASMVRSERPLTDADRQFAAAVGYGEIMEATEIVPFGEMSIEPSQFALLAQLPETALGYGV
ncbi:MAG TPA: hypothetical protein VLI54_02200 [Bacillota bacterium]|nr:hypothetical protein [Bacillota bacterium]